MKQGNVISKRYSKKNIQQEDKQELITIVLLCDNPGYRMKSYGPLSLISIKNTKLLDHQIQTIQSVFKNYEIIICLGFDSEKVCKYIRTNYSSNNIRIVENQMYNSSNSCESLRICLNNTLNKKILICDGGLILNKKSLELIDQNNSCVLFEKDPCENLEIGLNKSIDNIVQHFSYGAKNTWSEILFLDGENIIETLRRILVSYDSKTRFSFEAINELIKLKHNIKAIQNTNRVIKINNIKTYHLIKDCKI